MFRSGLQQHAPPVVTFLGELLGCVPSISQLALAASRHLQPVGTCSQSRWVHTTAAAAASSTAEEDYDLIAPEVGTARVDGLNESGFVVNDVEVEGSIMLAGDVFTMWRAQRLADVTMDSLSLIQVLKPAPDLLVLGCGRTMQQLPAHVAGQLQQLGIRVDAMDTTNAVATFNVLNQEGRKVVGALLPLGAA